MAAVKEDIKICLPHPYLTCYHVKAVRSLADNATWLRIFHQDVDVLQGEPLPSPLHSNITFTVPKDPEVSEVPPVTNNTPWARSLRYPASIVQLDNEQHATIGQLWLIIYALFTLRPEIECFRLRINGTGHATLAAELKAVGLASEHPGPEDSSENRDQHSEELVVSRCAFWQGAGSPFGPRPAWTPDSMILESAQKPVSYFPLGPTEYVISTGFPKSRVHSFHPRRPQKPTPGAIIYSRYIPHLEENFNMVALDYKNEEHLDLFHKWQNDPRVSAGWNETGTLEQHREYLRALHEDPHTLTVLARFNDVFFAYYETYWAKEDHFGVYCDAGDYDRGRHSLVGDVRFRGSHRVSAWWSSLMHYLFLDDPRTMFAVGEPKATNTTVLSYDLMCGFGVEKLVDLPHKRSAFMKCSRERFFQLCPLSFNGDRRVGGTGIELFTRAKI